MVLSRREFLNLLGCLMGGVVVTMPKPGPMARILPKTDDFGGQRYTPEAKDTFKSDDVGERNISSSSSTTSLRKTIRQQEREINTIPRSERVLREIGYFTDISPETLVFDENKYSSPKRQLEPSEWASINRHLPIKIDPNVINKPGERDPQALKRVVEYTQFNTPRYVAAPGERISMCNIAAWDWSRVLRLHLPHWIGETEMSANMLFRWISHPQAGGIYGEGWQPVDSSAAQLLANRGIPVFALAESSVPGRHGHVSLVFPENLVLRTNQQDVGPYFATVTNGRSRGGNGIKNLRDTFRWLTPTYFVHKNDFIVYRNS